MDGKRLKMKWVSKQLTLYGDLWNEETYFLFIIPETIFFTLGQKLLLHLEH